MQIDAVSQNPMLAAMSQTAAQSGSAAQASAAAPGKTDGDGDNVAGTAAVNDGDADDQSKQQTQSTSGIDIRV